MTVELISVGTELLLGNIVNTNANYLSKKCAILGLSLFYQITVGDNKDRLESVLSQALSRSDILIITGGLGPTQDDITKETVAKVLKRELILDEESKQRIKNYFYQFHSKKSTDDKDPVEIISENNWKQALKIDGSIVIDNHNGTAPGYIVEDSGKVVILLPGPPNELIPMVEDAIFPYLKKLQDKVFVTKMVKVCGIGESRAETKVLDLIEGQGNPTIAPYAKSGEVHFRITASAENQEEAERLIEPVIEEFYHRFGDNIYTISEEETLEEVVVKLLKKKQYSLVTAESCTAGLLSARLVNVPGISGIFNEGFTTYSNQAKVKHLGVKEQTLEKYGAVSPQTAKEMAEGAALRTNSDTALAITGIAGPGGGTEEKPVGLVYISCYVRGETLVKECYFKGSRQKVREQSVINALDLLRRSLLNSDY